MQQGKNVYTSINAQLTQVIIFAFLPKYLTDDKAAIVVNDENQ